MMMGDHMHREMYDHMGMHHHHDGGMPNQCSQGSLWHQYTYGMHNENEENENYCSPANYIHGCSEKEGHWKKCYGQLKDSCMRKEEKTPVK